LELVHINGGSPVGAGRNATKGREKHPMSHPV
jgi:hypothetical protein